MSDMEYVLKKQSSYSYAFRRLYKMIEECADSSFISQFKMKFNLNEIEWRSLLTEVKSFKDREIKSIEQKQEKIEALKYLLEKENPTKKEKYKINNKLAYFSRRIGKESTFGGLELQRRITREHNKKTKDYNKIKKLTEEFRKNRVLPFCLLGEANQKGNRFFDFSELEDGIITYKPSKGKKIKIIFKVCRNQYDDLYKLKNMSERKEISISVKLSDKYIYLTYDEEILHGYSIDVSERKKEINLIKKQNHPLSVEKDLIKQVYKKYYKEQELKKGFGKILNRFIGIDMNPTNIGWSVLDKTDDGYKVIACGDYDISKWCKNEPKSQKYVNNKRKYELSIIVKKLFNICSHYRCSHFVMEDLSFKDNGLNGCNKYGNRLIKNIWNRELLINLINRRCNENGVILDKVNSIYTSFIGNIQHKYIDATNASIEICRRGLYKFTKGMFYPEVREEDIDTLEAKFVDKLSDVELCSTAGWAELYKSLKNQCSDMHDFSYRWRAELSSVESHYEVFSMSSCKSGVNSIIFN